MRWAIDSPVLQVSVPAWRRLAHIGSLTPAMLLLSDFTRNQLSVNPIQDITLRTGKAALVLLVLTLACKPISTIFGFRAMLSLRRLFGLYTFGYASLHLLVFVVLDYGFVLVMLADALFDKPYALVGLMGYVTLVPLAITSSRYWMRRMGKRWKKLHSLIYVTGPLVVVHYVWLVKSDVREPLIYGGVIGILLVARFPLVRRRLRSITKDWL